MQQRFSAFLVLTLVASAVLAAPPTRADVELALAPLLEGGTSKTRDSLRTASPRSILVERPVKVLAGATAEDKALNLTSALAPLWGVDGPDRGTLGVRAVRRPHASPLVFVDVDRVVEGTPVAGHQARVTLTADGELVAITGGLASGRVTSRIDTLGPAGAVAAAAAKLDPSARSGVPALLKTSADPDRPHLLTWTGDRQPHSASRRWVSGPDGDLRLGWEVFYTAANGIDSWLVHVDGASGHLYTIEPRTFHQAPTGLVFEQGSPQPSATPGQVPPAPSPPVTVERSEVSFEGDPLASPLGWVGPDGVSVGNNVTAIEDHDANRSSQGQLAQLVDGRFDYPLELGVEAPPLTQFVQASITNLFYWTNWAHDRFYALGFSESAGNFQQDNLGRGGVGGDPLIALCQLGGTTGDPQYRNNAWMSTPPEGQSPTMGMYLWGPFDGIETDSSLDTEVIVHEYMHGVTGRLGRGWFDIQSGAMNEGNSDFMPLNLMLGPDTDPDGAFVVGAYSNQDFQAGIRSRPYSTDPDVNELTLRRLGNVSSGPQVHADGEIWVQALWEVRSRLIAAHGHAEGTRKIGQLLVDAIMMCPPNPSMLEARDAVLLAERARYNGVDQDLLWEGFAERGMGLVALSGAGGSLSVAEDFNNPSDPVVHISTLARSVVEGVPPQVWVADTTGEARTVVATAASGDSEEIDLTPDGLLDTASVPIARGEGIDGDGVVQVTVGDQVTVRYADSEPVVFDINPLHSASLREPGLEAIDGETRLDLAGDDEVLLYRIPIETQFSVIPGLIFVSTNGVLSGRPIDGDHNNSSTRLADSKVIAPLWYDLLIERETEGVFVAEGETWIRFRWEARTIGGGPVNFAVTVHEGDRIEFAYGSGNASFAADRGPTVGLGYAGGALLVDGLDQSANLGNAPGVLLRPPGGLTPQASTMALWLGDRTDVSFTVTDGHPGLTVEATSSRPDVVAVSTPTVELPVGQNAGVVSIEAVAPGRSLVELEASVELGAPLMVTVCDLLPSAVEPGHQITLVGPFDSATVDAVLTVEVGGTTSSLYPIDASADRLIFGLPGDLPTGNAIVWARIDSVVLAPRALTIAGSGGGSPEVIELWPASPAPGQRAVLVVAGAPLDGDLTLDLGTAKTELPVRRVLDGGRVLFEIPGDTPTGLQRLTVTTGNGAATEVDLTVASQPELTYELIPANGSEIVPGTRVTLAGVGGGGLSATSNRLRARIGSITTTLDPIADTGTHVAFLVPQDVAGATVTLTPEATIGGVEVEGQTAIYLVRHNAAPGLVEQRTADLGSGRLTVTLASAPLGSASDLRLRLQSGPRIRVVDASSMDVTGREVVFQLPADIPGGQVSAWLERRVGDQYVRGTVSGLVLPGPALVSAVASADGLNNTTWRSDLALLNPSPEPAQVALDLTGGPSTTATVPAGGQLVLSDVVGATLGTAGSGALAVTGPGSLVSFSRTFNLGPGGTFGQTFAGDRAAASLPLDEPVEIAGAVENVSFRTNLGLVNAGQTTATVRLTLRDGSGAPADARTIEIGPEFRYQVNRVFEAWAGRTDIAAGRITLELLSGDRVHAYASVVDEATGDPTTLLPQRASGGELWIAAASAADGVAGTVWRSDLVLANPGEDPVSVSVHLVGGSDADPLELNLAAGETRRVVDVIGGGGFGLTGNGALRLEPEAPVVATARIYNLSDNGTYGQSFVAAPTSYGLRLDEVGLLPMLAGGPSFRTNIGLVNPSGTVQTVRIEVLDDAGAVVDTRDVALADGEWRQLGDLVAADSGWARLTLTDGDGPVLAYASAVDNATGDPTTITLVR
jgi:hypothetical protein